MTLPPFATRLEKLRALREQLDREIADEEAKRARVDRARLADFKADDRLRAQREAAERRDDDTRRRRRFGTPAMVRDWARQQGYEVGDRGRISDDIWDAFERSQPPALLA